MTSSAKVIAGIRRLNRQRLPKPALSLVKRRPCAWPALSVEQAIVQWRTWFEFQGWTPFPFQLDAWKAYLSGRSGLIAVATGSGKTYAALGGPLVELIAQQPSNAERLAILYISPLKALVRDVAQAIQKPLADLRWPLDIAVRTGDTPQSVRRQLKIELPHVLVTTPESLAILMTDEGWQNRMKGLRAVVLDEWHELLGSKRGSLLELTLARLRSVAREVRTWALSATIANLDVAAEVAVGSGEASIIRDDIPRRVLVQSILPESLIACPWFGYSGLRLLPDVLRSIDPDKSTLLFTNTRSHAERWYRWHARSEVWATVSNMRMEHAPASFREWCGQVRSLIDRQASPKEVVWNERPEQEWLPGLGEEDARVDESESPESETTGLFGRIARQVYCHRDPAKWSLLYRVLWRLRHENRNLLLILSDADVDHLRRLEREVRRDTYRMTQFVRFKPAPGEQGDRLIAWHRPDHDVLELAVPFFVKRFASLTWSIVTPLKSAHWDGTEVRFAEGLPRAADDSTDEIESLWRIYYASVYDPARLNIKAMKAQMPVRHWATLPESSMIISLSQASSERMTDMIEHAAPSAAAYLPASRSLASLRTAAASCQGCALHCSATQTVFGTGPADASVMLVGEQPGDEEDLSGLPFVGPAGRVLNQALTDAGLDRNRLYLTNAVKHFKFVPAGKVRKHQKPSYADIVACRPWLEAEFAALHPSVVVCLGASAAKALFGSGFRLSDARGKWHTAHGIDRILPTYHPAAVLRAQPEARDGLYSLLVDDLRRVASI